MNQESLSKHMGPPLASRSMRKLNLGCGLRFHPEWTNMDLTSQSPYVQAHNIRMGIPFPDGYFDVVYHSHLFEHIPKHKALSFLQECRRILIPGGSIRMAVPDLEAITKLYLIALEKALQEDKSWRHNYEWLMLELYDQTVRERSGGAMLDYLKQTSIPNLEFVYERSGGEARRIIQRLGNSSVEVRNKGSYVTKLIDYAGRCHEAIRAKLIRFILGKDDSIALEIGRFRMAGEVHQWMYDRYSLGQLLQQAGFQSPKAVGPAESNIPCWSEYHLDTEPDGSVYKPGSLYMEAVNPPDIEKSPTFPS